ncbi:hypothetical protein DN539_33035, partial [Burkholderia multivorans]|uniref:hypothetical protein n=1 Tax=Burkholderia multivorans TaxID=87883 RepID=UPI000DB3CA8A
AQMGLESGEEVESLRCRPVDERSLRDVGEAQIDPGQATVPDDGGGDRLVPGVEPADEFVVPVGAADPAPLRGLLVARAVGAVEESAELVRADRANG